MLYVFAVLFGMAGGALCAYLALERERQRLRLRASNLNQREGFIRERDKELGARYETQLLNERRLRDQEVQLETARKQFDARAVSYQELYDENAILKRDLRHLDMNLRKRDLDHDALRERQESTRAKVEELGERYLAENVKWIGASITPNNYAASKQRLQKVIESVRGIGFSVTQRQEEQLIDDLKVEYERVVRAAFEREEQARIRAQIREEQKLEREVQRELERLERERAAIQAALDRALAEAKDKHSAEIEGLRERLAEAEARSQRAMSQAQLTKSGHVYVISNVGTFGDGVFKIGMTRRLEPLERVKELGDASVPFPFDVHMMIASDNAPTLENALHRTLHKFRLNKVNLRKEFFRTGIDEIVRIVKEHHGEVQYIADAEALEYRQSMSMTDEDVEYIEHVYDELDGDRETAISDE